MANPPFDPGTITIFNVDDNEAARYAKSQMLRSAGYRVIEVESGKEALRLAREAKPPLAILDVKLPDIDGITVCRTLKADPATASMMVLLVSAVRVEREAKVTGLEQGADGYLVEPVEADELLATVKALLRLHDSERRLQSALEASKKGEEELRRSRQHLELISDAVPVLLSYIDSSRRYRTCNYAYEVWFGITREQIIGKPVQEVLGEAAWKSIEPWIEQAFDGRMVEFETQITYRTVGTRWIHAVYTPDRDSQGHVSGIVVMVHDITAWKRAEAALASRSRQQERLYELARAVNRADELGDLYEKSLDAILASLNAERASILLFDKGKSMRFQASRGLSEHYRCAVEGHSPWKEGQTDTAPILIDDVAASDLDPSLKAVVQREGIQALGFIPLTYAGRVIGKFMVYFDQPHRMTEDDLGVARGIADTLATGIERKRAEQALRKSEQHLAAELSIMQRLQDLSTRLIHRGEMRSLLQELVAASADLTGTDKGNIQLFDPRTGHLRIVAHLGLGTRLLEHFAERGWTATCDAAMQRVQRVIVEDVAEEPGVQGTIELEIVLADGIRAIQSTPLVSRDGRLLGMLNNHFRSVHRPSESDLRCLDLLARMAADLIESAAADETLRKTEERVRLLAETADLLLRSETPQMVVEMLCKKVMAFLDCHVFFNYLFDPASEQLRLNACAGIPEEEARRIEWLELGSAVCGCVARDGTRIVAEHISDIEDVRTELVKSYGIRAYACHPMVTQEQLIGTLSFGTRTRDSFSEDDLSLMKAVTDQVAIAMQRKQNEEALRESEKRLQQWSEQLEQRVTERTEDLLVSEERLRGLATELNLTEQRERKKLAAVLHDHLAQMLVLCRLQLSQSKRIAGVTKPCLDLIQQTDDILADALTHTRTLVADLVPSVLHDLGLPAALKWLGEQMSRYEMSVTVDVEDSPQLKLPEDQAMLLFQSVRELLMNTCKHAGTKKASVSLARQDNRVCIQVRDKGQGFETAAAGNVPITKFGLFSIRERMRALGGWCEIESGPGQGTTATLVLPLRPASSELGVLSSELAGLAKSHQPSAISSKSDNSEPRTQHSELPSTRIRVLLADDHAMVRQGLRSLLETYADVEVVGEAGTGEEAVAGAVKWKPAVVIMDVNMPRLNGIEATARIKAQFPETVVIGLSVQSGGEARQAMLKAGAAMLLTKEAAVDQLYASIREALVREQPLGRH